MQMAAPGAREQLAGLSGPVRDCIIKAARLRESQTSRQVPDGIQEALQTIISQLDPASAVGMLTQLYGPSSTQSSASGLDFDHHSPAMPSLGAHLPAGAGLPSGAGLPAGALQGSGLAGLVGLSGANPQAASLLNGSLGDATAMLPAATGRDVPNQGERSSISHMSSQLRALVDDQPAPQLPLGAGVAATSMGAPQAGAQSFRPHANTEEQLASLLGASSAHMAAPAPASLARLSGGPLAGGLAGSMPVTDLSSLCATLQSMPEGHDLQGQLLGQLQGKDTLSALLAGTGAAHSDLPSNVPNILTSTAQRMSESGRDLFGNALLDDNRSAAM